MKIYVYIGDVSHLNTEKRAEYLENLSEYRKNKCLRFKYETGKNLSLGAGYLLSLALQDFGLNEKYADYGFSENGKPYILHYPMIDFNLSHSGTKVMCVSSSDGIALGCDVEQIRSGKLKVANRFFTENENRLLESLSSETEKDDIFAKLWTLKESYIKCTGEGLGRPMDTFEFFGDDGELRVRVKTDNDAAADKGYVNDNGFITDTSYGFICLNDLMLNEPDKEVKDLYKSSICYKKRVLTDKPVIEVKNIIL